MKIICAWCQTEMYETLDEPLDAESHGICPQCKEALKGECDD